MNEAMESAMREKEVHGSLKELFEAIDVNNVVVEELEKDLIVVLGPEIEVGNKDAPPAPTLCKLAGDIRAKTGHLRITTEKIRSIRERLQI